LASLDTYYLNDGIFYIVTEPVQRIDQGCQYIIELKTKPFDDLFIKLQNPLNFKISPHQVRPGSSPA